MIAALFFISVFGFLCACRQYKNFCACRSWGGFFGAHLIRMTELFLYAAALFLLYRNVLSIYLPAAAPLYPALFLLSAYVIQRLRKKDEFFLWLVYALCLYGTSLGPELSSWSLFFYLFKITAMIFLFTVALLGLQRRLLYSDLPVPSSGLPVYFLCAAVLALLLWVFQGFLS